MVICPCSGGCHPQRDVHSGHHGPGLRGVSLLRVGQREAWAWGGGWVTGPAGGKVHAVGQRPVAAGPKDSPLLSSEGARRRSEGHRRVTAGSSAQGSRTDELAGAHLASLCSWSVLSGLGREGGCSTDVCPLPRAPCPRGLVQAQGGAGPGRRLSVSSVHRLCRLCSAVFPCSPCARVCLFRCRDHPQLKTPPSKLNGQSPGLTRLGPAPGPPGPSASPARHTLGKKVSGVGGTTYDISV